MAVQTCWHYKKNYLTVIANTEDYVIWLTLNFYLFLLNEDIPQTSMFFIYRQLQTLPNNNSKPFTLLQLWKNINLFVMFSQMRTVPKGSLFWSFLGTTFSPKYIKFVRVHLSQLLKPYISLAILWLLFFWPQIIIIIPPWCFVIWFCKFLTNKKY